MMLASKSESRLLASSIHGVNASFFQQNHPIATTIADDFVRAVYAVAYVGFTDITAGGSVGCNGINGQTGRPVPGGSIIPYASWNATTAWDPVTGFGVPNFATLLRLALEL